MGSVAHPAPLAGPEAVSPIFLPANDPPLSALPKGLGDG